MEGKSHEEKQDSKNLMMSAIKHGLDGISYSQSSKAISLDENEIYEITDKSSKGKTLDELEQRKLTLHNIQSGNFKSFFTVVNKYEQEDQCVIAKMIELGQESNEDTNNKINEYE